MCTDAYLREHPCDIPWMPDESGACTILIADHINTNGPSRRIMMAYHAWVAIICLSLTADRLVQVCTDPLLRTQHRGPDLLAQPQALRVLFQLYASLMLALQGVDIHGYGGRLHFGAWHFFHGQTRMAMGLSICWSLGIWYESALGTERRELRSRRGRRMKGIVVLAFGFCYFILQPLEVFMRPMDAPLGVLSNTLRGCKALLAGILLVGIVAMLTAEYVVQRRKLLAAKQGGRGADGVIKAARRIRPTPQFLESLSRSAPVSDESMGAAASPMAHGAFAGADAASARAMHQLRKFIIVLSALLIYFCASSLGARRDLQRCWSWKVPPDTQYVDRETLVQLICTLGLCLAHLKTYSLCLFWGGADGEYER